MTQTKSTLGNPSGPLTSKAFSLFHNRPGSELALSSSSCSLGGVIFLCSAGHWSAGGPQKFRVAQTFQTLSVEESCSVEGSQQEAFGAKGQIAVAPRGQCSFGTKSIVAQQMGFEALVIIDPSSSAVEASPPGLGAESCEVLIPVVMSSKVAWEAATAAVTVCSISDNKCKAEVPLILGIELTSAPDEAALWHASPWYSSSNVSLSSLREGRRYAPVCSRSNLGKVSDDAWLYHQWLDELDTSGGCTEIDAIKPQFRETKSLSIQGLKAMQAAMANESSSYGLVRLPGFDAVSEPMHDPDLLMGDHEDARELLSGTNSNSHHFPWGGGYSYPRFFMSNILVIERG